jgi:hypothetical protein
MVTVEYVVLLSKPDTARVADSGFQPDAADGLPALRQSRHQLETTARVREVL